MNADMDPDTRRKIDEVEQLTMELITLLGRTHVKWARSLVGPTYTGRMATHCAIKALLNVLGLSVDDVGQSVLTDLNAYADSIKIQTQLKSDVETFEKAAKA